LKQIGVRKSALVERLISQFLDINKSYVWRVKKQMKKYKFLTLTCLDCGYKFIAYNNKNTTCNDCKKQKN
jgi:uncharacterized OB-fold protein